METNQAVFVTELTDAYKDQLNLETCLKVKGEVLGVIEFTIFREQIQISCITVRQDARRQGLATMLVKDLQSKYPESEIDWGQFMTDAGQALYNSLPMRTVPSAYAGEFETLKKLQDEFAAINTKMDLIDALPEVSPREQRVRMDLLFASSELDQQIESLGSALYGLSATKRLVDITKPVMLLKREAA